MHEWIAASGGSELVLEQMASTYPDADIFTLWNDTPQRFAEGRVQESWIARTPLRGKKVGALPFMSATWRRLDLHEYDWLLASSHLFAHHAAGAAVKSHRKAFIYVHTPARYIWVPELDERGGGTLGTLVSPLLRTTDKRMTRNSAQMAANSRFIQTRIQYTWGRESTVIYPPVAVEELQSVDDWAALLTEQERALIGTIPNEFLLGASRFVSYKQLDRVIEYGEACDLPVIIAGNGPEARRLEALAAAARVPVTLVLGPSSAMLRSLMQRALAYIFLSVEDFGIMPVEAMALGTPTVVNHEGGAIESVEMIKGGSCLEAFDRANYRRSLEVALEQNMDRAALQANSFSNAAFAENLRTWMMPLV